MDKPIEKPVFKLRCIRCRKIQDEPGNSSNYHDDCWKQMLEYFKDKEVFDGDDV